MERQHQKNKPNENLKNDTNNQPNREMYNEASEFDDNEK